MRNIHKKNDQLRTLEARLISVIVQSVRVRRVEMSLRPGSKETQTLFSSEPIDIAEWQSCLDKYDAAVSSVASGKSKSDLVSWDNFLWNDLHTVVSERSPPHLTLSDLAEVMKWKLARGKARPLQKLLESNPNTAVVKASTDALKLLDKGNWEGAINALCTLKAVGVATATAVLAPFAPDQVPFMADEVIEATSTKRDYTMKIYKEVRTALVRKATQLSEAGAVKATGGGGGEHVQWTAEGVGKALWTRSMMVVYPDIALQYSSKEGGVGTDKQKSSTAIDLEAANDDDAVLSASADTGARKRGVTADDASHEEDRNSSSAQDGPVAASKRSRR